MQYLSSCHRITSCRTAKVLAIAISRDEDDMKPSDVPFYWFKDVCYTNVLCMHEPAQAVIVGCYHTILAMIRVLDGRCFAA